MDEILALDPAQCKMDKRKLRFERCKNAAKLEAQKKIAERKEKASGKSDSKKAYNSEAAPVKRKKPKVDLGKVLEGKPKVIFHLTLQPYKLIMVFRTSEKPSSPAMWIEFSEGSRRRKPNCRNSRESLVRSNIAKQLFSSVRRGKPTARRSRKVPKRKRRARSDCISLVC